MKYPTFKNFDTLFTIEEIQSSPDDLGGYSIINIPIIKMWGKLEDVKTRQYFENYSFTTEERVKIYTRTHHLIKPYQIISTINKSYKIIEANKLTRNYLKIIAILI